MAASRCGEHDNPKVAYALFCAKTPPDTLGSLGVTNITRWGFGSRASTHIAGLLSQT